MCLSVCLSAGAAHWELLLRARAVECQAYVIAAAQAGRCVLSCTNIVC